MDRFYIDQEILEPTTVTVSVSVDGLITAPEDAFTQVYAAVRAFVDPVNDGGIDDLTTHAHGLVDFLLEDSVTLQPGQQWFDVVTLLSLVANGSDLNPESWVTVDFSHTASLDVSLPDGLAFRSEGGFTGRATAVPEPTSIALLGAGLLGLAMLRLRHRPLVDQERCWRTAEI